MTKSASTIQEWLVEHLAQLTGLDPQAIDVREPLINYGLDSIEAVRLSGELEVWLGKSLSPLVFYTYPTLEAVAEYLVQEGDGLDQAGAVK